MKHFKRLQQYKASNLIYDIAAKTATSYKWYQIAKEINGTMIINSYNYSSTTVRHYYKMVTLFNELGIAYEVFEAPRGLQDLPLAVKHYQYKIDELQHAINKPRSQERANARRSSEIATLHDKIAFIHRTAAG